MWDTKYSDLCNKYFLTKACTRAVGELSLDFEKELSLNWVSKDDKKSDTWGEIWFEI